MRALAGAAAALGLLLGWLAAHEARAADADSTDSGFSGLYGSSADPDGYILIHRMVAEGQYQINASHRFQSMGYLTDGEYAGVLRLAQSAGRTGPIRIGWLKFKREGDRVGVQWSEELGSAPTHTEIWTLVNRYHRSAATDSVPPLGDAVSVDSMPRPIETTAPIYPPMAQRKGIEGTVVLQVRVGADGRVGEVFVLKSIPELDAAAVAAVKEWRFRPAQVKGAPVAFWAMMPVRFKLR